MSACTCSGCPHAANCRCVCPECNAVPPVIALPWSRIFIGGTKEVFQREMGYSLGLPVGERPVAEEFQEPNIVEGQP